MEISAIAEALSGNIPKFNELVEELEMSALTDGTEGNPKGILNRWKKEMELMGIPTRELLLVHLHGEYRNEWTSC